VTMDILDPFSRGMGSNLPPPPRPVIHFFNGRKTDLCVGGKVIIT
jgi:hypothetical protein